MQRKSASAVRSVCSTITRLEEMNFIQENFESVLAIPYDMPIVGYGNNVVNTLRIWDAKAITSFRLDSFDRGEYHKAVEQENLAKSNCGGALSKR